MNMRIFKYPLEIVESQAILVPKGSKYISLLSQNDRPCVYAAVDPLCEEFEDWFFEMRGTGHVIDEETLRSAQFLGTITTHDSRFVWHIWRTGRLQGA